jgi:uncharacterized protein YndB with AHSA1/START domain
MPTIEESIAIKRPIEKVFLYTLDIKSWPKWFTSVSNTERTSQGQFGVGTTVTAIGKGMGMKVKMIGKVTGYEPNKTWSKEFGTRNTIYNIRYSFDSIEGGTKVTQQFDIKLSGFMKLFSSTFANSTRKRMKVALNNLKNILEAQA